jgi:hypothetical protein
VRWPVLFVLLLAPRVIAQDAIANELADVRLAQLDERHVADGVLLSFGGASMLVGPIVATALHDQPMWLSFGIATAVWGAVNALASLFLLEWFSGSARGPIEVDRALRGEELARARERALRGAHENGAILALNLGLDVFYIAGGILMFFFADQMARTEGDVLRGSSLAMSSQGTFLFAFDLSNWILSGFRADRISRVPFVRW